MSRHFLQKHSVPYSAVEDYLLLTSTSGLSVRLSFPLHHEPFNARSEHWRFDSSGPLSGANGALAWIVFRRDRRRFEKTLSVLGATAIPDAYPTLLLVDRRLETLEPDTVSPDPFCRGMDRVLLWLTPQFGSFVDIEVEKTEGLFESGSNWSILGLFFAALDSHTQ